MSSRRLDHFQEGISLHYDWEDEFPDTYEEGCQFLLNSPLAVVITEVTPPFLILQVNDSWIELCGYSREVVIGRSFRFMQGALTSISTVDYIVGQLSKGLSLQTTIINYKQSGKPFHNFLRIKPLRQSGGGTIGGDGEGRRSAQTTAPISHFIATLQEVDSFF